MEGIAANEGLWQPFRMAKLVYQFQQDLTQSQKGVTELLRFSKMIAVKLGLSDIDEWINAELTGYKAKGKIPEYRKIT